MIGFWIVLAFGIMLVFFLGLFLGKARYAKHCYKNDATKWERRAFSLDNEEARSWAGGLLWFSIIILAVLVPALFDGIKNYYIDKWRTNEIVEQATYHYKTINGEKILVDSTFQYVKNLDE